MIGMIGKYTARKMGRVKTPTSLCSAVTDTRGVTAIEFAMIMPFFIVLLFAIIEVSIMFFTASIMEGAVNDAARQIRTGQAQQSVDPLAAFQDKLCASTFTIIDCGGFTWDVRSFQDFESADLSFNTDGSGALINTTYDPGSARDIVIIRVAYRFDFNTPLIQHFFADAGPLGRLIMATSVFRNEPYAPG